MAVPTSASIPTSASVPTHVSASIHVLNHDESYQYHTRVLEGLKNQIQIVEQEISDIQNLINGGDKMGKNARKKLNEQLMDKLWVVEQLANIWDIAHGT
jgi:hypothetical protein